MKPTLIFLIFGIFILSMKAFPADKKEPKIYEKIFSPHFMNFQYAGNTGLGSIGIGYISKNGKNKIGLNYGYLPKSINGVQVHTLSAKGDIHITQIKLTESISLNGYTGTNFIYSMTHNTFAILPDHYLDQYYLPTAFHFAPFLGLKFGNIHPDYRIPLKVLYIELGTLDYYLINSIKHSFRRFSQSWNLCIGITLPL